MRKPYSKCCGRPGLTLIEVMTALALLSTLLVTVLLGFTRNARHLRAALVQRRAVAAVDALLYDWLQRGQDPPRQGEGDLPGMEGYRWETRVVSRKLRQSLGLEIVRLQVHAKDPTYPAQAVLMLELPLTAAQAPASGEVAP